MNHKGFAHPTALIVSATVIATIGATGYTVYKANSSKDNLSHIESIAETEPLPTTLEDTLTLQAIEEIVGTDDTLDITNLELRQKNGQLVFKISLSDGTSRTINARTGSILSDDDEDDETALPLPKSINIAISFEKARDIAQAQFPQSKIEKIKLETESGTVIFSVRFVDKARVDLNAQNGGIVRTKTPRDESESRNSAGSNSAPSNNNQSSSGSSSGSSDQESVDDEDESTEAEAEIKVEGILIQNGNTYTISTNGKTYTIQTTNNISSMIGKKVRAEGELRANNHIVAKKVELR